MPESVLRVQHAVAYHRIGDILERIFSLEREFLKRNVTAFEKRIFRFERGIADIDIAASPTEFGRHDVAVFQCDIMALAKRLHTAHRAVVYSDVSVIPQCGAAALCHAAFADASVRRMPERISEPEGTASDRNVPCLLEG